jgi:hypothetical protein
MRKKSHDMCEFCEGIVEERIIQARFHFKGQTIYVDPPPYVSGVKRDCVNHKFGEGIGGLNIVT